MHIHIQPKSKKTEKNSKNQATMQVPKVNDLFVLSTSIEISAF